MKIRNFVLLLAFTIAVSLSILTTPINAAEPTASDLVAAVNAYRVSNGYYAMNPHTLVYQAAQTHAQWIVDTGQGGHIGAGGSHETDRVSWTGYGGGAPIQCDENWASGRTIEDALYGSWADWTHQEVMLNQWGNLYTDIGAGVADAGGGRYVFVLNVCKVIGQEASGEIPDTPVNDGVPAIPPTPDYSNYITGVKIATPQADGTITHIVQYGQTLATIAKAYGITIEEIRALNGFAADFTAIWPDDKLIIVQGTGQAAPTPSPTIDLTKQAQETTPTPTPRPTYTPSAMDLTATAEAAQSTEGTEEVDANRAQPTLTAGLLLLIFAGLGLVILIYFTSAKKQE